MSREGQDRFRNPQRNISLPTKNNRDYKREVKSLNAQLKRLKSCVLNPHPYLLSVPSDVPYRHSPRFVNTWYVGTPFVREEEQLQYVSFLPHQDDGEELLNVVGGWSDEKGNMIEEEESPQNILTSGRNTPLDAHRKKISLNDYKTKGKATEITASAEQPRKLEQQSKKIDQLPAGKSESLVKEKEKEPQGSHAAIQGKKRQHEGNEPGITTMDGSSSPNGIRTIKQQPTETKMRPQIVSLPPNDLSRLDSKPAEFVTIKTPDLPDLLSPTLPSPGQEKTVPALVSPTLPPSIAKFLTSHAAQSQIEGSFDLQRTDPVRSILVSAGLSPSSVVKKSTNGTSVATGNRVRSDSQHSVRSTLSATSVILGVKTPVRPGTPLNNGARASPGPRQRHIVALKYGKKNRKWVESLLKFASRPKKPVSRQAIPTQSENGMVNKPKTSDQGDRHKKRFLEDSPERPSKRPKPLPASLNLIENPSTPIPLAFKSPSIQSNTSLAKSVYSTPKKDLKPSAMQRVASSEGMDVRTPPGDRARLSTPLSIERSAAGNKVSPPPTSAPTNREEEKSAWQDLNAKYFALGRTIKREATSIGKPGETSNAMSVVLLIEGLLCFMINLAALSHSQHSSDPGWAGILPYHIFVFKAARPFPHLHGVVVQLGAVCRQYIHKYDMDRLARDPLPDEQFGSAPTPGSDGNTKTNEDGEKYKKRYLEFRDRLVENSRELQRAWMDGSRELSLDTLEREYPKTWRQRAKDSSLRGVRRPTPTRIPDDFFLPLDANATAFEAVRFSLGLLGEWTENEKVVWKSRIEI